MVGVGISIFSAGGTAKNVFFTTADNDFSDPQIFSAPVALKNMAAHTSGELASRFYGRWSSAAAVSNISPWFLTFYIAGGAQRRPFKG
jgi:hypothetical protein